MSRYGLLGKKLGHSFSREIHSAIGGYEYELIQLDEGQLKEFLIKKVILWGRLTKHTQEAAVRQILSLKTEELTFTEIGYKIKNNKIQEEQRCLYQRACMNWAAKGLL